MEGVGIGMWDLQRALSVKKENKNATYHRWWCQHVAMESRRWALG